MARKSAGPPDRDEPQVGPRPLDGEPPAGERPPPEDDPTTAEESSARDEEQVASSTPDVEEEAAEPAATPPPGDVALAGTGPGGEHVSPRGIVFLVALHFVLSVLFIYVMLAFWPTQAGLTAGQTTPPATATTEGAPEAQPPAGEEEAEQPGDGQEPQPLEPPPKNVSLFGFGPWEVNVEILFFLIVALAGAIGGLVASVRSLGLYIGSRKLTRSWIPFYLFKPLLGALLATVVYLLLRAGLFSPSASNAQVSPYGFAAIGALVGLFSEHAAEKLRRVANELFNPPYEQQPPDHYAAPEQLSDEQQPGEAEEQETERPMPPAQQQQQQP